MVWEAVIQQRQDGANSEINAEDILGRVGGDENGKSGSCRLWLRLEDKEEKSKVLWSLGGNKLRTKKSQGSSCLSHL